MYSWQTTYIHDTLHCIDELARQYYYVPVNEGIHETQSNTHAAKVKDSNLIRIEIYLVNLIWIELETLH